MKVHIKEENISGCGGEDFADTAVEFDTWLSREALAAFHDLLRDVKRRAIESDSCVDTDHMVQQALDEFPVANGRIVPLAHAYLQF